MRINLLLAAIDATALICANALPARAETFRVGRLLCASAPRVGLVLGSTQSLRCVFHARNPPRQYVYVGRIRRVGPGLGVNVLIGGSRRTIVLQRAIGFNLAAGVTSLTLDSRGRR
jgi:hypothetical protein